MTVTSFLRDMRWSRFDLGIAALAAVSACFVAYAAPDWRLFQLISALRLNDIVPALDPPLGNKIRLAFMAGAAAIAFAGAFALMQLVDRIDARRRGTAQPVPEVLRLRRADVHPDAPARRPILAGRELGEPEPAEAADAGPQAAEAAEAPPALEPAAAEIPEFLAVRQPDEPEPAEPAEAGPEPLELTEPVPLLRAKPTARMPEPEQQQPEQSAQPSEPDEEEGEAQSAAPEGDDEGESLSKLMRRLESGIGRREADAVRPMRPRREPALPPPSSEEAAPPPPAPAAAAAPEPEAAPPAEPEAPARHRLRSAIQDLEKLTGSR
ncbi:MAG: hypothetical protein ACK40O_01390 [Allosphingosinicella sp.]